jgi:hypothetical protein
MDVHVRERVQYECTQCYVNGSMVFWEWMLVYSRFINDSVKSSYITALNCKLIGENQLKRMQNETIIA